MDRLAGRTVEHGLLHTDRRLILSGGLSTQQVRLIFQLSPAPGIIRAKLTIIVPRAYSHFKTELKNDCSTGQIKSQKSRQVWSILISLGGEKPSVPTFAFAGSSAGAVTQVSAVGARRGAGAARRGRRAGCGSGETPSLSPCWADRGSE